MAYIKFANVFLKSNEKNILDNVSFDIKKGDVCLVVSQTLSGITSIISTETDAFTGVVMINDLLVNSFGKKDKKNFLNKIVHIHPQNELIKNLTVYENIYLSCVQNKKEDKIKYYINKLGLSKKTDLYPLQ